MTLPLIRPALLVAVIFRALDALRIFDLIYVLTGNNKSTMSMSVFARQQLVDFQDVGYGSAASTLLFLLIAAFTVVYLTLGRRRAGGARPWVRRLRRLVRRGWRFYLLVAVIVLYTVFPFYCAIVSSLQDRRRTCSVDRAGPAAAGLEQLRRGVPRAALRAQHPELAVRRRLDGRGLAGAGGDRRLRARAHPASAAGRLLLFTILGVSMFPQIAVLSGMFELVRALGLYNTLLALILSYMIFTLPFTVWVLDHLHARAAAGDRGGGDRRRRHAVDDHDAVFLPLMGPALVTTGLLAFIAAWNEFLFALTFTLSTRDAHRAGGDRADLGRQRVRAALGQHHGGLGDRHRAADRSSS